MPPPLKRRFANASLKLSGETNTLNINRPLYTQDGFDQGYLADPEATSLAARLRRCCGKASCSGRCWLNFILGLFPFINIMKQYRPREDLLGDIVAGLTVGVMNIPQGMAYALLAGVPPIYGLYVSFFPVIIYFFFGTARQASIGTFAVVCLMIGNSVESQLQYCDYEVSADFNHTDSTYNSTGLASYNITNTTTFNSTTHTWVYSTTSTALYPTTAVTVPGNLTTSDDLLQFWNSSYFSNDTENLNASIINGSDPTSVTKTLRDEKCRVGIVTSLALLVGGFQILMGIFRLGFLTIYLADPLISGFTTGSACHVLTTQVKYLLGIKVQRFTGPLKLARTYIELFSKITTINWAEVIIAVLCILILVLVKQCINERFKSRMKMPVPIELIVVVLATVLSYVSDLYGRFGVSIMGDIPARLPVPAVPPMDRTIALLPNAFTISIVAFAVSVSMAKVLAKKNDYQIDPNQELMALGLSNGVSSFFSCFPSCSSLSRSVMQDSQGGKSQIAGLVSCSLILLVLVALAPYLATLPRSVLASIIVVALKGMFKQFAELKRLWSISYFDFAIWLVTWTAVVVVDVDIGLAIGVIFGLLTVVFRTQHPQTSILARVPHSDLYMDASRYLSAQEIHGVKIFRFNSALYYANSEHFRSRLYKLTAINPRSVKLKRTKIFNKVEKEEAALKKEHLKVYRISARPLSSASQDGTELNTYLSLTHSEDEEVDQVTPANQRDGWPALDIHHIIIDCSMMGYMDSVGVNVLSTLYSEYGEVDITVFFAGCQAPVREIFKRCNFYEKVPNDKHYLTIHDAVIAALASQQEDLMEVQKDTRLVTRPGSVRIKEPRHTRPSASSTITDELLVELPEEEQETDSSDLDPIDSDAILSEYQHAETPKVNSLGHPLIRTSSPSTSTANPRVTFYASERS